MTQTFKIASVSLLTLFAVSATAVAATTGTGASPVSTATTTFDAHKPCKAGFRYSHARKRCVRIQRRGSY